MPTPTWRKSSYSGDASNCVEIATAATAVHIRDSKRATGPHLTVHPSAWTAFMSTLRERSATASCAR
ncbi:MULTISPECIES: DUF397 domain-containing protein [unclassified Streptomyces]|uniref:DUF397 domain-containing protein n=1 Tax=unclassified Streptomyces TaxID=2593676 RepID=UPI0009391E0F|nr:DUF397 domain-containing protein [Streptomyces sp. TSRI0107]